MKKREYSIEVGGKTLTAEFNDLVDQASGSVLVKYGDTVLLATAVMSDKPSGGGWFPLTVDYEEKFYAAGQILGSQYIRREGRPSEEATLSGRLVDRTIRPLFDQWIRHDIQVVLTVLSIGEDDPDVLGIIGASLALGTSDIPWKGPVSAVRLGANDDQGFSVNPVYDYRNADSFSLDLLACGKDGKINMIEVGSHEVGENKVIEGLEKAKEEIEKLQKWQKGVIKKEGREKRVLEAPEHDEETLKLFEENIAPKMEGSVMSGTPGKKSISALEDEWMDMVREKLPEESRGMAGELFQEKLDDLIHREALENDRRPDGRGMDEVRPLYAQAGGLSDRVHGSGIFYRGGTHILSVLTLGGPGDAQTIDGIELQGEKSFMHHYNFPPFSVGETGRIGGANRRMIGHGALAEKALLPVIPSKDEFPYTIRIVSEALASNGSTSMGSVCGSSLALMDAGVPIKRPVAGIASGLMMNEDGSKYKVLTDIQGPEDHHGDMDFKVAGTTEGITAIQMDVKISGVTIEILKEALEKAKNARLHILKTMNEAIAEPRKELSPYAPRISTIKIPVDMIGLVIGPGGKSIKDIKEKTGAEIDIEDDGTVYISGIGEGGEKAKRIIEEMTKTFEVGEKAEGEVVKITNFGAFVKIGPKIEGLLHISEIAPQRIEKIEDFLKVGDKIPVIIKEIDDQGRLKFSLKDRDPNFFKK